MLILLIKLVISLFMLLYGIKTLSENLKEISNYKFRRILSSAANHPLKALFLGIFITALLQSSSATTVILISLVNSNILDLKSSVPIIMGANIGTTITSQLLRFAELKNFGLFSIFTPSTLAPILIIIGLIFILLNKSILGKIFLGLGMIFTGMMSMVESISMASSNVVLPSILSKLSNPIFGFLFGVIFTAIVQSSSATIGLLQAFATTGLMTYSSAIPIILGQNIGTCSTSILACFKASINAKRVAFIHLLFNICGAIIFTIFIFFYQKLFMFSFWNKPISLGNIANFHLLFNCASAIFLFPFIEKLEKCAIKILK